MTTNPIAGTRPERIDERVIGNWQLIWQGIQRSCRTPDVGGSRAKRYWAYRPKLGQLVTEYMEVEFFRCVMHLTSVVKGQLLPGLASIEALKATLPAGTVSVLQDSSHEANL